MKKFYVIFERDFQDQSVSPGLIKYHKLGVNNRFNTRQEAELFLINPENIKLFTMDVDYTILPIYEKSEMIVRKDLKFIDSVS